MLEKIRQSINYINNQIEFHPTVGIITGTGSGNIIDEFDLVKVFDYKEIPNFSGSTVEGHVGKLVFGILGNRQVAAMKGRLHYYEGHGIEQVIYPVRIMKYLGIEYLILTNASGSLNPLFRKGDLMVHTDHINLLPNPLIGQYNDEFGERFPDMSEPYNHDLIMKIFKIAENHKISMHKGCYVGVTGPSYETPAEYKFLRIIGGDAVGMSTVPEVIVARQMGMKCLAVSIITDLGVEGHIEHVSHAGVLESAGETAPKLMQVLKELIQIL